MRRLLLAALLASTLTGVANADPIVCNEPWQPVSHPPEHLPPCHPKPGSPSATGDDPFAGIVTLPTFPCTGGCTATFDSTVAAGIAVSSEGGVTVITHLQADVTYEETCTNGQALTGTATGTATWSGIGPSVTTGFSWTRVGLVAVITGANFGDAVVGAATFVPTGGPPTCTGGSVTVLVSGSVVMT